MALGSLSKMPLMWPSMTSFYPVSPEQSSVHSQQPSLTVAEQAGPPSREAPWQLKGGESLTLPDHLGYLCPAQHFYCMVSPVAGPIQDVLIKGTAAVCDSQWLKG